jgi:hypothetical protein
VRPYWKGYLKLALVSCPIALHAACSTAERIAFRQINKPPATACASGLSMRRPAPRSPSKIEAVATRSWSGCLGESRHHLWAVPEPNITVDPSLVRHGISIA